MIKIKKKAFTKGSLGYVFDYVPDDRLAKVTRIDGRVLHAELRVAGSKVYLIIDNEVKKVIES